MSEAMGRCEALPIAVRVFTTRKRRRDELQETLQTKRVLRRYPHEVLVFDTETTVDPSMRLLIGAWRFYRDAWDGTPGVTCIEEGFFYPDDLPTRDPKAFALIERYVKAEEAAMARGFSRMREGRRLRLVPVSWWLDHQLFTYGYQHRNRCDAVGFNLLFDLGRLARYWGKARGYFRGGFSMCLWGRLSASGTWRDRRFHPRLLVKAIDPRRTLFAWGSLKKGDEDYKGADARFVDLRTLAFALRDESLTLQGACAAFDVPYEKRDVRYGLIDEPMLTYLREDVEATANLYRACRAELAKHEGIDLPAHRLYSPATVGAAYLEAMGLEHPMEKFADLDPRIHGWAMSAFFGGRAEARIVRTRVPVAYVDATSMYPTVNALLGTWQLLTAARLRSVSVTRDVREILEAPDLFERCFDRSFWEGEIGVTLVEIEDPSEQILPARAYWNPNGLDPGIGVNSLTYDGRLWYMLPDLIASVILCDRVPKVRRAIRLRGVGTQAGLRPVLLRGHQPLDPTDKNTDPFVAMIQERKSLGRDGSLSEAERKRLDQFLKITANSAAYGILARFDRRDLAKNAHVTVYGADDEPMESKTLHPEDPGPFAFPAVAASLTAGARLMLALLERSVLDAGGAYAFCDTDSMGIVTATRRRQIGCRTSEGETITALAQAEVRRILARFETLNPYDRKLVPELWKQEFESLDRPLTCFAISAKRYALFRDDGLLRVVDASEEADVAVDEPQQVLDSEDLVDRSEHGLGRYLDPIDPEEPQRDEQGRRVWMSQAWDWILGRRAELPEWERSYALTRFTVSTARVQDWFRRYNDALPRERWVQPGSFGLIAHPSPTFRDFSRGELPAAPYDRDPRRWQGLPWYDRRTGDELEVNTLADLGDPDERADALATGTLVIDTLGDIVRRYLYRAENKSLGPDGSLTGGDTVGLLRRRPIHGAPVLTDLVGKEGNRLTERLTGEITDPTEYRTDYGGRVDRWSTLVVPVMRAMGAPEVARRVGRSRRAIERALRRVRPTAPHTSTRASCIRAAAEWAGERLGLGSIGGLNPLGVLYCYLASRSGPVWGSASDPSAILGLR